MSLFDNILNAFWVGGLICVLGQILIDKTKLMPGRILVIYVCAGCILGAGATVPLTGFGYNLAKGVMEEIDSTGFLGIYTGGLKSAAGGIAGAVLFSWLAACVFEPKGK